MNQNTQNGKDTIFSQYREKVADFVFDQNVVSVFDDMIRRSVPGYATVIAMSKVFAEHYAQPDSNLYDLGCSLGTTTLAMRKGIDKSGCRIIAVDNSPAMIERCTELISQDISEVPVDIILDDIANIDFSRASVVALNFTLQFFNPAQRDVLLKKIFAGMLPGAVLILSEKIEFESPAEQDFQFNMHLDFKRLNGYSNLEVSQKRKSLENVLIPDTIDGHMDRLKRTGFDRSHLWFQCFNFVSIAAFKK